MSDNRVVTEDATGLVQADFVAKMTQRTLDLRAEGYSFRQIGKELGVSGQSAHRWYTRARAVQLQELRGLRETAFYRDLAAIQDKLDQCEAVWDVTAADSMPRLAGLIKLYETKAKFLRYADLEFAEESAEPPTREQLAERLARVRRIVGDRIEE